MRPNTPPLRTNGTFTVHSPYALTPQMTYICDAVFTHKDLSNKGIDIFKAYYEPVGLTIADFSRDMSAGAAMVTLVAADNKVSYIPDTYIASYPGLTTVKYRHNVAVVELGLLPDTVDVTLLGNEVAALIKQHTGATVTMNISAVDYDGEVTAAMHTSMETARKVEIRSTPSNDVILANLEARNAKLTEELDILTGVFKKIKSKL